MSLVGLEILENRLKEKQKDGLSRSLVSIGPCTGPFVTVRGRKCLLMANNDYLGFAGHEQLIKASQKACAQCGTGSGASRLAAGTLDGHFELEKTIARFKHTQAGLFFSTGYMANLAAVSGLTGPNDLVISDELNHASIIDAARLSKARVKVYAHKDVDALSKILEQEQVDGLKLVITDGVFSMDGDIAPIPEIWRVCQKHGALLAIDDAHATGVLGKTGRGSIEHFDMEPQPGMVLIGTFSKALGGLGGFIASGRGICDFLIQGARSFLYTTAPPPSQVACAKRALELVDEEPFRREKLDSLAELLRQGLRGKGFTVLSDCGPILPVLVGNAQKAVDFAEALLKNGVYAPAMRPPTVPLGTSRIRTTVSANHSPKDIETAINAFVKARKEIGL